MQIHAQFRAAIIKAAKAAKPGLTDSQLEAIVARVAGSDTFSAVADFLTDDLRAVAFSDFDSIVRVFALSNVTAAAPVTTPEFNQRNPITRLGAIYAHQAGPRDDIEGPALDARIANNTASASDVLTHARRTPAKKEAETPVNTKGLDQIKDPARRLAVYRERADAQKNRASWLRERGGYEEIALDKTRDALTRARANQRLAEIDAKLKELA